MQFKNQRNNKTGDIEQARRDGWAGLLRVFLPDEGLGVIKAHPGEVGVYVAAIREARSVLCRPYLAEGEVCTDHGVGEYLCLHGGRLDWLSAGQRKAGESVTWFQVSSWGLYLYTWGSVTVFRYSGRTSTHSGTLVAVLAFLALQTTCTEHLAPGQGGASKEL